LCNQYKKIIEENMKPELRQHIKDLAESIAHCANREHEEECKAACQTYKTFVISHAEGHTQMNADEILVDEDGHLRIFKGEKLIAQFADWSFWMEIEA
jgi:hypothetical protein